MIGTWGPDLYYTPEYWPSWLKVLAIITLAVLAGIVIHALLRVIMCKKSAVESEPHKFYLYTKSVRIWHWLNAIFFIVLLATGLLNHFTVGNMKVMVRIHNNLGLIYIILWAAFIFISIVTGNIKQYIIQWHGVVKRIFVQTKYYLYGILKCEPHPFETTKENKFNPIQQVSYIGVVFMLIPLIIITGLVALYGHSALMLKIHLALGAVGLIFLIIHVYMCTTGDRPSYLIKGMIDGYHREDEKNE